MLAGEFLEIRARTIERIIRLFLPSVRQGTLKATAADIHGQIYMWIHEDFDYHQDFVVLFQSLFGVTFTEMDLRFYPITVFRHDLRCTWLTTRTDYETAPVFRIRWEASEQTTALRSADGVVQAFEADRRRPLENLAAIFIETLNSFASLSRSHIYLSEGGMQFPTVEIATLSITQLTRILREVRARIITYQGAFKLIPVPSGQLFLHLMNITHASSLSSFCESSSVSENFARSCTSSLRHISLPLDGT